MTFQRAPHFLVQFSPVLLRVLLHAILLSGAVVIVLSQFFQYSQAQVLYMPASEYGKATLNYTPEAYNPENVFDVFSVFESIRDLIGANQHDAQLSAPIGRLNLFLRRKDGAEGTSFCTASLISDRHIITNYHCIPGIDKNIRVERATLRLGYLSEQEEGEEFKVNMRPLEINQGLDYSILELTDVPSSRYGTINLSAVRDPKPLENLFIIHHPGGKPKAITRERCYMHPSWNLVSSSEIFHKCDTQAGSSGAIVFSDSGEPVGIHWGGYDETLPLEARYNVAKKLTTIIQSSAAIKQLTGATARPDVPSANGILKLSSSPLGAEVYLNGEFIGNTPIQASIPEGNYQADLKLQGHEEFSANVVMRRDTETAGSLRLTPAHNTHVYGVAASQHRPQAFVMPEGLTDFLVDPYAAYATAPPPTVAAVAQPINSNGGLQNASAIGGASSQNNTFNNAGNNTGNNSGSNITMIAGARPVNPNLQGNINSNINNGVNNSVNNALMPYITPVLSAPNNTIPTSAGYVGVSTSTTDGGPTSAFSNSAAVNPSLNTYYAQSPHGQTPVDIDPINPTQAGDDTAGLGNPNNGGIAGLQPQGARWQVVGRGESANMERMGFVIVHDASTLFKLWARAYGNVSVVPALPSIDFARESVVGIFLGVQPAGNFSLQINNVLVKSELTHVYVTLSSPYGTNVVPQSPISPWILVRVPKERVGTVLFYDSNTSSLLGIAEKQ